MIAMLLGSLAGFWLLGSVARFHIRHHQEDQMKVGVKRSRCCLMATASLA